MLKGTNSTTPLESFDLRMPEGVWTLNKEFVKKLLVKKIKNNIFNTHKNYSEKLSGSKKLELLWSIP